MPAPGGMMPSMFRQVVVMRFRDDADDGARRRYLSAAAALAAAPGAVALRFGEDVGRFPDNHDVAFVIDFPDFEASQAYVASPVHQGFVAEAMQVTGHRVIVQHEWGIGEISGLHHVKLPVTDVARSRDWYTTVFGFTLRTEFREDDGRLAGVALEHSTGLVLALRADPERAAALAGFDAMCLAVGTSADLDLLLERLDAMGVAHSTPTDGFRGTAVDIPDPDGLLARVHTLQ